MSCNASKTLTTKIPIRKCQPVQETIGLNVKQNPVVINQAGSSAQSDVMVEINPDEWFCSVCEENAIEDMVQCLLCGKWVHESCAGSKARIKKYVCSNCSS
ncbi:hypothetical protein J6590_097851 [Homalodisca vitripennis]|nr:hypothetical protein J6590_097851 [Homalodisca vitripennis]